MTPVIEQARITVSDITFVGRGLVRPECVVATGEGLFCSDWRGGVVRIAPNGTQTLFAGTLPGGRTPRPNGIAVRADGSFLFADLGVTAGGVFSLTRDGQVRPLLESVDGCELPPTNFVVEDGKGRTWITVSTRLRPRDLAYRPNVADGFIVLMDAGGARIVADGLGYTNEARVSPDGHWLYVNETFGRKLTRFRLHCNSSLGTRETVTEFDEGTYPDGLAFDENHDVWITSVVSNRIIRVARDGAQSMMLEDTDPAHVAWAELAFQAGTLGREHLDRRAGHVLANISSLAFGGFERRTVFLGCLLGDSIATFRAPVAGYA